jgi:hypothetical protein
VSAEGSPFRWRCGTCETVLAAENLETIRADVLDHIRDARRRGVEPRCRACGDPISEANLEQHTTYCDDGDLTLCCGVMRALGDLAPDPGERKT